MASVSFLARSVARRSVDKLVRVNPQQVGVASSLLGSVRWSTSYFTPGKKRIANKQEPACLPACQLPKASYALGTGSTLRCKEINWEIRARPFPPEFSLEFWRLQCPCTLGVLFNCWCWILSFSYFSLSCSASFQAHEYVKVDGKVGTVGITDFAQSALGDIVFIDLPEVGDEFEKGDSFGSVESVKAASDVYAPVSGKVVEVNSDKLTADPALVNSQAEGDAWFIKLELTNDSELSELMGPDAYKAHCEKEGH